jgi:hypothetical protein
MEDEATYSPHPLSSGAFPRLAGRSILATGILMEAIGRATESLSTLFNLSALHLQQYPPSLEKLRQNRITATCQCQGRN